MYIHLHSMVCFCFIGSENSYCSLFNHLESCNIVRKLTDPKLKLITFLVFVFTVLISAAPKTIIKIIVYMNNIAKNLHVMILLKFWICFKKCRYFGITLEVFKSIRFVPLMIIGSAHAIYSQLYTCKNPMNLLKDTH